MPTVHKGAFFACATIVASSAVGCAVGLRDSSDDGGTGADSAPTPDATPTDATTHPDASAPMDSGGAHDASAGDSAYARDSADSGNSGDSSDSGDSGDAADSTTAPMDATTPDDAVAADGPFPPNATAGSCDPFAWTASALYSLTVPGPDGGQIVATPPSYAIDGLQPSRWTTGLPQDNANFYYQLDFGGYVWVSSLTVDNHYFAVGDVPHAFDIAAANDGVHFSDYRSLIDGGVSFPAEAGPVVTVSFPRQATRFLRIQITSANQNTSWWSMEEVHVGCEVPDSGVNFDAGVPNEPPPPIVEDGSGIPPTTGVNPNRAGWTATAWPNSSTVPGDQTLSNAFDDLPSGAPNLATRWSDGAKMAGDEYFVLDLGKVVTLNWITLTSNTGAVIDSPRAWELQFSSDGTTWTAGPEARPPGVEGVNGDTDLTAPSVTQIPLPPTSAQYIRINQLGASASWWSLHDITVYGQ